MARERMFKHYYYDEEQQEPFHDPPTEAGANDHAQGTPRGKSRPSNARERVGGPQFKDQFLEAGGLTNQRSQKISSASSTTQDLENAANLISAEVVEPSLPASVYHAQAIDQRKETRQRRCMWILGFSLAAVVILAIAGGVGVYFGLNRSSGTSQSNEVSNAPEPSTFPTESLSPIFAPVTLTPTLSRTSRIESALFDVLGVLPEPNSSQGEALDWLINVDQASDGATLLSNDRLVTRFALATLFYATNGPSWTLNGNFLSQSRHECDWNIGAIGVACNSLSKVTSIILVNNRLGGTLPTEIGLLSYLEFFNLRGDVRHRGTANISSNHIKGNIPKELKNLSNLIQLDLSRNGALNGTIPAELSQLNALVELRLNENSLTGVVPAELGDMVSLSRVDLSNNFLTGAAPTSLTNIRCASLSGNNLTSCFFRRNRLLQASLSQLPEDCFHLVPPCGLPSSN